jgi:hypothetical protein
LCVKGILRFFQLSLQSRRLIEVDFTLNVISGLVVLSPEAIKGDILKIVLKGLCPVCPRLVKIEPVDVHALILSLQSNQVAIVLSRGVDRGLNEDILCVTVDIVGVLGVEGGHILREDDGGVEPPDQLHVHEVLEHH